MRKVGQAWICGLSLAALASGAQLITNGTFESGNLSGWTVANAAGSFAGSGFLAVTGAKSPFSQLATAGAASGSFYALSDQQGPGAHALLQSFVVPNGSTVLLSFDLFVNSPSGQVVNPIGLDSTDGANQYARVDLLRAGASAFDIGSGVLQNLYLGVDAGTNPRPYVRRTLDLTQLTGAGGTFQLRFAEVDNVDNLNMGIDNVSIIANPATAPEPKTGALFGAGAALLIIRRSFRRRV